MYIYNKNYFLLTITVVQKTAKNLFTHEYSYNRQKKGLNTAKQQCSANSQKLGVRGFTNRAKGRVYVT